ncbi:protein SCO1/2 [Geothermobacter ehrlichii]|uniref:Protein SCO1/2 n=2 Tax=Geothermobacter ehrlichii TaxID=213224 RepID=A0A5D3WN08_9BACT|nr:protein SCO1/2 [Geothermobacter ehrlichii]
MAGLHWIILLWLVAASGASVVRASTSGEPRRPPKVGIEERLGEQVPPDIMVRDELGRQLRLGDLFDRPVLLAPVYYRCSNVCNALQASLAQSLPKLGRELRREIRVLSFSFDPDETPAVARGSKKIYRAAVRERFPMDSWLFLTADAGAIRRLTTAIGYRFYKEGSEFVHPVAVVVLAPGGRIVRYLEGTRFLATDLSLALLEASEGRIGSTISRLASLCYSYDPERRGYVFNILRVTGIVVFLCAVILFLVLMFGGRGRRKKN